MPFKNKEEKRQFIIDHEALFVALGIELTEEKIQELVDEDDKDKIAAYIEAKKLDDDLADRDKKSSKFFGPTPHLGEVNLDRIPRLFYDNSGTPEAEAWNEYLKKVITDPVDGARNLMKMCVKKILDFDDSILTKSSEEIEKFAIRNHRDISFLFSCHDMMAHITDYFDMNKPEEAAIVNAVREKYVAVQGLDAYVGKFRFQASKISVILPKDIEKRVGELLGGTVEYSKTKNAELNSANEELARRSSASNQKRAELASQEFEAAKAENEAVSLYLLPYGMLRPGLDDLHDAHVELLNHNLIGKEGIYNRAYIIKAETNEKQYLSNEEVIKLYTAKEGDKVHYEPVSAEAKSAIDNYRFNTLGIDEMPLWPNENIKREYLTALRKALKGAGYNMSDKDYQDIIDKNTDDMKILRAKELEAKFADRKVVYQIMPNPLIAEAARTVGGFYLKGDSEEIKLWNENVSLLAQSREGIIKLTHIAAKRLLSIDMDILTDTDTERRTKYLLEHPVEGQLAWITANVLSSFGTILPLEEITKNPVYNALLDRKVLLENFSNEKSLAILRASRVAGMLPNLDEEQSGALYVNMAATKSSDPAIVPILKELELAAEANYKVKKYVDPVPASRTIGRELYSKGTLNNDSIYKRLYTIETVKDKNNKEVTKKVYHSWTKLTELLAENSEKVAAICVEELSQEDRAKLDAFLADTPENPVLDITPEERKRLRNIRDLRGIKFDNDEAIKRYAEKKSKDTTIDPELRELYANAVDSKTKEKTSEVLAKAFKYVNEHREYSKNPVDQEKLEIALTTIAILDGKCAKNLVQRINLERKFGGFLSKPVIDLEKELVKAGVKLCNDPEKTIFNYRDPFDKRLQNVKEIYDRINEKMNPWYHVSNGAEFKKMMQTMNNVLEYASTSTSPDSAIIEMMLKEVKEASKAYVLNDDASREFGQNRRCAALAVLASLDPEEAAKTLEDARYTKKWIAAVSEKMSVRLHDIKIEDIIKREAITQSLPKEKILERMKEDIERTKENADIIRRDLEATVTDPATVYEEPEWKDIVDLAAECVVKEKIYDSIKNGVVDHKSTIALMSKFKVKENSGQILQDDVYRMVINNMKLNQNQYYDKVIDKIEKDYQLAKTQEVKTQKEAAEAEKQAVQANSQSEASKEVSKEVAKIIK